MKLSKRLKRFSEDFVEMIKTPVLAWCAIFSFLIFILVIYLPIWRILPLVGNRPYIQLHYNIYLGVDRFGDWRELFVLPILGFGLILLNLILQTLSFRHERLLSILFGISTVFLELILLCAMGLIVLLNLSYAS